MPQYKVIKVVMEVEFTFKGEVQTVGEAAVKAEKLLADVPGAKVVAFSGRDVM